MAKYLDETGLNALWAKIKQRIQEGVGDVDLSAYLQVKNLATINGQSLANGGNITIDLTLFKVVDTLPTSDIDENKIYLVKSDNAGDKNIYTEYVYVNNAWEKIGEYSSDVDLSDYAKTADVNTALETKVDKENGKGLSTNDYTDEDKAKLENITFGDDKMLSEDIMPTTQLPAVMVFDGFVDNVTVQAASVASVNAVYFDTTNKYFVGAPMAVLGGVQYYDNWADRSKYNGINPHTPYTTKVYVHRTTNIPYRWDGTTLVPISTIDEAIAVETVEALS